MFQHISSGLFPVFPVLLFLNLFISVGVPFVFVFFLHDAICFFVLNACGHAVVGSVTLFYSFSFFSNLLD